jgi:transcriptional regulator with XRE-family HTH domain
MVGGGTVSDLTRHIGGRIRLYRKNKNMSIENLAQRIQKSKATISKYEKGDISIDIETLSGIASVLNVSLGQLTDYQSGAPVTPSAIPRGLFSNGELYLYYYDGRSGKLIRGFLQIRPDMHTGQKPVTMYMGVDSFAHYTKCKYLYSGSIDINDAVTNLLLHNQANGIERINIFATNPLDNPIAIFALLTGMSGKPFMPMAVRCILSSQVLPEDDELVESLTISRDDIKLLKKYNLFTCDAAN